MYYTSEEENYRKYGIVILEVYDELMLKIENYIFFYNNFRIQSNLKGMTPNEFMYHSSCNYIYF